LSLKENVNAIKEELSAEEQFLESVIKAEGFWKKYKKIILTLAVLLVLGLLTKVGMEYMQERNLHASNEAYNLLLSDSKNSQALADLKKNSPKLYELYLFKSVTKSTDVSALEKVKSEISDPILKNLLSYQIDSLSKKVTSADAGIAQPLALLQEGYLLLQEDKIKEANAKFVQIPADSSLRDIVANLKHYSGK
jgi:hypothetical protein